MDAGEYFYYTTRGNRLNIQYHYNFMRVGIESNMFFSNISYDPYYENEGGSSIYYYIDKADTKSINIYGISTNLIGYVLPQVLYIKLGILFMSSQYFEGYYKTHSESTRSSGSPTITYFDNTITSSRYNSNGLSLGTGLLIPIYKQVYINCGIDYYFTTIKPEVTIIHTENGITKTNKYNPAIKYAYINLSLGLSYQFNKKQIRK
ncbi:MAG: hypothetical protein NTU43_06080 [Bacteroidetes bacterium]|nr:hypothetical protein [Bacteroidota bacterium]